MRGRSLGRVWRARRRLHHLPRWALFADLRVLIAGPEYWQYPQSRPGSVPRPKRHPRVPPRTQPAPRLQGLSSVLHDEADWGAAWRKRTARRALAGAVPSSMEARQTLSWDLGDRATRVMTVTPLVPFRPRGLSPSLGGQEAGVRGRQVSREFQASPRLPLPPSCFPGDPQRAER